MVDERTALDAHKKSRGKIEVIPKVPLRSMEDLSIYYTPGVAYASLAIKRDRDAVFEYTSKSNTVVIFSDGTRILGLGNVGPEAGLPVMEGKAALFKKFGGIDAFPLCVGTTDEEKLLALMKDISPTFGAINIEDIESPKAFRLLNRIQSLVDIPVFHDDQQGTAVVAVAGLMNALKLARKGRDARIVINGAGTAGLGVANLAVYAGFTDIVVLDSKGAIYEGRKEEMNEFKQEIAMKTNKARRIGSLEEIAEGADALVGLSKKGLFTEPIIRSMAERPIVFALANPDPEVEYEDAKRAGAFIAATGKSNAPNQVNNVLAFPGMVRGLLDVRARGINEEMLYRAAIAASKSVGSRLSADYILPGVMDRAYYKAVANIAVAVAEVAMKTGMARVSRTPAEIKSNLNALVKRSAYIERRLIKG